MATDVRTRFLPLKSFMQDSIEPAIPLSIPVPVEYEPARFESAPFDYSYWMRPSDVPRANEAGDLPAENGYMYGKLSMNVGYEVASNVFIGLDNMSPSSRLFMFLRGFTRERIRAGAHEVVLMKSRLGKLVYSAYIATNIDTNVVYVAYRPAGNSRALGNAVWNALRTSLLEAH